MKRPQSTSSQWLRNGSRIHSITSSSCWSSGTDKSTPACTKKRSPSSWQNGRARSQARWASSMRPWCAHSCAAWWRRCSAATTAWRARRRAPRSPSARGCRAGRPPRPAAPAARRTQLDHAPAVRAAIDVVAEKDEARRPAGGAGLARREQAAQLVEAAVDIADREGEARSDERHGSNPAEGRTARERDSMGPHHRRFTTATEAANMITSAGDEAAPA